MNGHTDRSEQAKELAPMAKRAYVAPVLVSVGTVAELTQVNIDTAAIPDRGSS